MLSRRYSSLSQQLSGSNTGFLSGSSKWQRLLRSPAAQPGVWILHSTHPTAAQPALLFKITLQPPCSHVQPIAKVVVLLHVHMLPCRLQIACITCRLTKQVIAGRSQKRLSSMGAGGEKRPGANARVDSWRAPKDRDKQRSAAQAERVVSAARYQGPDLELAAQLER